MTDADLEKIKAYVRATSPYQEGAWFDHWVRMQVEQWGWAQRDTPGITLDEFLKVGWRPRVKKPRR